MLYIYKENELVRSIYIIKDEDIYVKIKKHKNDEAYDLTFQDKNTSYQITLFRYIFKEIDSENYRYADRDIVLLFKQKNEAYLLEYGVIYMVWFVNEYKKLFPFNKEIDNDSEMSISVPLKYLFDISSHNQTAKDISNVVDDYLSSIDYKGEKI